ncbi:helix-turn-helix domain-containing protein [Flagellimonas abyssi]|uniref:Helix-turn-helix domain-containing protein n=1 Tax=Flagellimonas abyssi TaxID=2864871 RepID=A0ABS7EWN3_9FLAO|nr:helix-turn-helix domain-containing protein [Allomuricauda abyssi]MBW8202037.1 helix-turn-helix domain-containing protein [Allomuricauda abyssi]
MDSPENKKRLEDIYNQLVHIANGNFSYQIERTDKNDALEALTFLVNSTTEELRDAFLHQGFIKMPNSYEMVVQLYFELDGKGQIIKTNPTVDTLLHYKEGALIGRPFVELLDKSHQKGWKKLLNSAPKDRIWELTLRLTFTERSGLQLSSHCHVIYFPEQEDKKGTFKVTSFDLVKKEETNQGFLQKKLKQQLQAHGLLPKPQKTDTHILRAVDLENLRKAKQHIMDNLDMPLPSIKELAHFCNTNEYKFKKGFKELFGMTAFQFQKHERLRKAHILIEHSNKTILAIAKTVGFKKGNHFAREFKKRYGYSPSVLRRLSK